MTPALLRHLLAFFGLALAGQYADLVTKHRAFERIGWYETVEVVPGWLQFQLTYNTGAVFGLGEGYSGIFLAVAIGAVPLIVAIFLSVKVPRWITTVSLGLILAGTLGNMYDRLTIGKVRDFIKFPESLFRMPGSDHGFPLFNLADSFICIGVALMLVDILIVEPRLRRRALAAAAAAPVSDPTAPGQGR
jgi:signal peptidase II